MAKLPINIDSKSRVIIIKAVMRGKRDSRIIDMVLDTGASITTIPTETALAIGCDPSRPKRRIEMITASGTEYVPIVLVPEFEFLGFRIKDVEAACLNLPPQSRVSGLLGINVLKNFDILLAFLKKTLEVTK